MSTKPEVACVWTGPAVLGESPVWDADRRLLWWIDCVAPALHAFEAATRAVRTVPLEERIHAIGLRRDGGLIAATGAGLVRLDPETGQTAPVAHPERERPDHRFNDGKCGPDGGFWIGSMHRGYRQPSGRLYHLAANGEIRAVLGGLTVPNGLGWSPDGRTFYLGDSPTGTITAHEFNPTSAAFGAARPFADRGQAPGWPDGLAVDAEGYVWNARWNGGCVARFAPDGRLDRLVEMPVGRPTSCAFGGPRLDTLYVTSARIGLDDRELAAQPLAGALFAFEAGVEGLAVGRYAG